MKNAKKFDVLVIYPNKNARSASDYDALNSPFPKMVGGSDYNSAYAYFLQTCKEHSLTAAFSTIDDVVGSGTCKSYWHYTNNQWQKEQGTCFATTIFDKFSPTKKMFRSVYDQCFSSSAVQAFNNYDIAALFSDKLRTYQALPEFSIPTVALEADSQESVLRSIKNLKKLQKTHPQRQDFSRTIIMKDRFGASGNEIYKISSDFLNNIQSILAQAPSTAFILQPYLKFDTGFNYKHHSAATDIRILYQNQDIIQTYIRIAKNDDFRCNQHQGGKVVYTTSDEIPKKVHQISEKVIMELGQPNAFFALDYIVSNSGFVYLLEGNSNPGIVWEHGDKKDEQMTKQLMQSIVGECADRIELIRAVKKNTSVSDPLNSFAEVILN